MKYTKIKPNAKHLHLSILSIFLLTTLTVSVLLAGCTTSTKTAPTETSITSSQISQSPYSFPDGSEITISPYSFPDGSEITMEADSSFEIINIAGESPGISGHEILLHRGEIVVESKLPAGTWFTVLTPNNHMARVTGSIMMLALDPITGQFMIDCIEGKCELGPNLQDLIEIAREHQGCLDEEGNFYGPYDDIDFDELRKICIDLVPTETNTPEPTLPPDSEATATASCQDFESQFPGTPCP